MDKLKTIYIILSNLEDNKEMISNQELTKADITSIIKIMVREELVVLKETKCYVGEKHDDLYIYDNIEITMKGLQYRKENSKIAKTLKVIKVASDFIP